MYSECLNEIPDSNYGVEQIHDCLGRDNNYVMNDFDHLVKEILSKTDTKIRLFLEVRCYQKGTESNQHQKACSLFEKDVLNLLWKELDYAESIKDNRIKYTFEFAHIKID